MARATLEGVLLCAPGVLFAVTVHAKALVYATQFPNGNPQLEVVDLDTGSVANSVTVQWNAIINDIAYCRATGILYGLSTGKVFTIDVSSGATTLVVDTQNTNIESIAFRSTGTTLFAATQQDLFKVDLSLHSISSVGSYGSASNLGGQGQNIRFAVDGQLYLTNTSGTDTSIYRVNDQTGVATWLGLIKNHPYLTLGNGGDQLYGVSVPNLGAINGTNNASLVAFDVSLFPSISPTDPNAAVVHRDVLSNGFPDNINLSGAVPDSSSPVPEPGVVAMMLGASLCMLGTRQRKAKGRRRLMDRL